MADSVPISADWLDGRVLYQVPFMHRAVAKGDLNSVRSWVREGRRSVHEQCEFEIDITRSGSRAWYINRHSHVHVTKMTPLHVAFLKGHDDIADVLLRNGARMQDVVHISVTGFQPGAQTTYLTLTGDDLARMFNSAHQGRARAIELGSGPGGFCGYHDCVCAVQ
mmetsp:Transcript_29677/g.64634  ORF Transcript_29677/g.64634 Transcript_29677/m.64634 type:complete len:165 (+) Transcript_29677:58-552(+)